VTLSGRTAPGRFFRALEARISGGDPLDQPEASAGKERAGSGRSGVKVLEDPPCAFGWLEGEAIPPLLKVRHEVWRAFVAVPRIQYPKPTASSVP